MTDLTPEEDAEKSAIDLVEQSALVFVNILKNHGSRLANIEAQLERYKIEKEEWIKTLKKVIREFTGQYEIQNRDGE
jgi:N-acetyl-anhydromuramyl-L-alanine amidase AmpD